MKFYYSLLQTDDADRTTKRLTVREKSLNDNIIKGTLLSKADNILSTVSEIILEKAAFERGPNYLSPIELEIAVTCKLELASIARQRHHSIFASQLAFYAAQLIKENKVLETAEGSINRRLWLKARLDLVKSRAGEVKGMGLVKGSHVPVECKLATAREYCAQGVAEAESWGEPLYHSHFLLQSAILDIVEGIRPQITVESLNELVELSDKDIFSCEWSLLKVMAICHCTDVQLALGTDNYFTAFKIYSQLHSTTLNTLKLTFGQDVKHKMPKGNVDEFSTVVQPINNIFSPFLSLLVNIKHRLGHCRAETDPKNALTVLREASAVHKFCATFDQVVEAEMVLLIGKIEKRLDDKEAATRSLLQAISLTYNHDHDLSRMREAYSELTLIYLTTCGLLTTKDGQIDGLTKDGLDIYSVGTKKQIRLQSQKTKKSKDPLEEDKLVAWVILKCTSLVGQAQRRRAQIAGENALSIQIPQAARLNMPQFACLDLVSNYVLGEKKKIYKTEIEREMAPLVEAVEPPPSETYDQQLNNACKATEGLSWVHVIGYQSLLNRLSTTESFSWSNHAQNSPVRTVLFAADWRERSARMHEFLRDNLPSYSTNCLAPETPEGDFTTKPIASPEKSEIFSYTYSHESKVVFLNGVQRKNYKDLIAVSTDEEILKNLHTKLVTLMQKAELLLVEQTKKESHKKDKKSTSKLKTLTIDEKEKMETSELDALLRVCVTEIRTLFGKEDTLTESSATPIEPEIPFDVSKKNIDILENYFNMSFGFLLKEKQILNWMLKTLS